MWFQYVRKRKTKNPYPMSSSQVNKEGTSIEKDQKVLYPNLNCDYFQIAKSQVMFFLLYVLNFIQISTMKTDYFQSLCCPLQPTSGRSCQ